MTNEAKERRKYKRKTYHKHGSKKVEKAEVNLNSNFWIDYKQLIMDCFDYIFISTEDLAYFTLVFSHF